MCLHVCAARYCSQGAMLQSIYDKKQRAEYDITKRCVRGPPGWLMRCPCAAHAAPLITQAASRGRNWRGGSGP